MDENFIGYYATVTTIAKKVMNLPPEAKRKVILTEVNKLHIPPIYAERILKMSFHRTSSLPDRGQSARLHVALDIEFFSAVFERASLTFP